MGVAKDSINVLMEGTPSGLDLGKIYDSLMKVRLGHDHIKKCSSMTLKRTNVGPIG